MKSIDLVDRIVPDPLHTVIIETPDGSLVLVSTEQKPKPGDTVLVDGALNTYQAGILAAGVAYCIIRFL